MSNSQWMPPSRNHSLRRIRHIYYMKENIPYQRYIQVMKKMGVTPTHFLPHLGMIVGEALVYPNRPHLDSHPDIQYAEPDIRITITEPYVSRLSTPTEALPWGILRIEAPKVWRKTQGKSIRVAVIDTGIDSTHPALRKNYWGGTNILAPSSAPQDYNGHGTHVSGIIAAHSNEMKMFGVSPRVRIYGIKAFNRNGNANLSDLLQSMNWCIDNGMDIINMSFGMENVSESLRQAIRIAHRKGIIMVAASGNKGIKGKIDYPASFPETIAVTSISKNNRISLFANQGKNVDIAAPGDKILSSWIHRGKREMSGTSMAVPHVTGTIALMLALNRQLNPEQIRYALRKSAQPIHSQSSGVGVVNAYRAIRYLP